MDDVSFGIYIPSYRRARTATTHRFLEYGKYVVRKSEEAEYRSVDLGNCEVMAVEDDQICGLTEVNQWLIDNAPEEIICVLDDDLHQFLYRMFDTYYIEDPEVVTSELERIGQLMADLEIGFAATDPTIRPWNYDAEFHFKGTAGGVRWVNRRIFKAHCVKELEYNYDIDLVLQELMLNRIILKPKYFCSNGLTDTNEGGASDKKRGDQIASINLMRHKWGRYFTYNFNNNTPRINVVR